MSSEMKKKRSCQERVDHFHESLATNWFSRLGRFMANHSIIVVIVGCIIAGLFGIGLVKQKIETDPLLLWVPEGVRSVKEKIQFDEFFGPFYRIEAMITLRSVEGENMLSAAALEELYHLSHKVFSLSVDVGTRNITFRDFCALINPVDPTSKCIWTSPLDYWWNDKIADWDLAEIQASTDADLSYRVGTLGHVGPLGIANDFHTVYGGARWFNGTLEHVNATFFTMLMLNSDELRPEAVLWEAEFLALMRNESQGRSIVTNYQAESSIEVELASELLKDVPVLFLSYIIMLIFVGFTMGHLHVVRARIVLGFFGILVIVLTVVMSLGLSSIFGIIFTPVSVQVLPFLILGIGVNDMFIVTTGFWDERHKIWKQGKVKEVPISETMGKAIALVGPSCVLTSTADFVAFMLAAITNMPAVRAFCFQVAIAVVVEVSLVLTAYIGILALDARRIEAGRLDVCCCVTIDKVPKCNSDRNKRPLIRRLGQGRLLASALDTIVMKWLVYPTVAIGVILLFVGFTAFSIYGVTQSRRGLGLLDAVPSTSYIVTYENNRTTWFANVGPPVYLVFPDINYTDWVIQDNALVLGQEMIYNKWLRGNTGLIWLESYSFWAKAFHAEELLLDEWGFKRIPPDKFYEWLPEFLDSSFGETFNVDLKLKSDANGTVVGIDASRFWWRSVGLNDTDQFTDSIHDLRRITDLGRYENAQSFPYSVFYIFFEQYDTIASQTVLLILVTCAAVFVVLAFFLAHIPYALLGVVVIMQLVVCVIGVMAFWEMDINPLSVVNLVMAAGMGVEFVAHVLRRFNISKQELRSERVREAMRSMGAPVIMGALSTFLSIVVLAGSVYPVFQLYYFRMYFLIVIIGIGYGILYLPALLSLGSKTLAIRESQTDRDDDYTFVPLESVENIPLAETIKL